MNDAIAISQESLHAFLVDLLKAKSFFAFDAKVVASAVVEAERCGHTEDGLGLVGRLLDQLERGEIDPRGRPLILDEAPALVFIDGSSAAGPVGVAEAAKWLAAKTGDVGAAVAVIKGSREAGHPAIAVTAIAEAGFVGVCSTSCLCESAPEQATTRVGAAFPGAESPGTGSGITRFETDDDSTFAVVLSALASGHAPEAKAASANSSVAEHVIVAIDPGRTTNLQRLATKLDAFSEAGRVRAPVEDAVRISGEMAAKLGSEASLLQLALPWNS